MVVLDSQMQQLIVYRTLKELLYVIIKTIRKKSNLLAFLPHVAPNKDTDRHINCPTCRKSWCKFNADKDNNDNNTIANSKSIIPIKQNKVYLGKLFKIIQEIENDKTLNAKNL